MEKEIHASLAYWRKVNPKYEQGRIDQLEARLTAVLDFQRRLKNRLQQLHDKKANKLIAEINPHATGKPPVPPGFDHKPAPPAPAVLPFWADPAVKICTISDLEEWRAKAEAGEESAYFRAKLPYSQWFDGPALIQLEKEREEQMQKSFEGIQQPKHDIG